MESRISKHFILAFIQDNMPSNEQSDTENETHYIFLAWLG